MYIHSFHCLVHKEASLEVVSLLCYIESFAVVVYTKAILILIRSTDTEYLKYLFPTYTKDHIYEYVCIVIVILLYSVH